MRRTGCLRIGGQEGKTALRDYQTRLGHLAIDAGASAVIGHHPHILQGIEHYKDGIILYSLGNFTFGSYSMKSVRSAVAQLRFRCRTVGHPLGSVAHHSDLWIAATAIHIGAQLVTVDGVFGDVPGLGALR